MKLVYLLSVAAIATATTLNASAFDADLKGKNENQLKATVMQERREINRLRTLGVPQPHHAHLRNGQVDVTDTDILLDDMESGVTCAKYIAAIKTKMSDVIDPWMDGLMAAGNNQVLEANVGVTPLVVDGAPVAIGGKDFTRSAGLTRDDLKAALHGIVADIDVATLDNLNGGVIGVPARASLSELTRVAGLISNAINEALVAWFDDLDAGHGNKADQILAAGVAVGGDVAIDGVDYALPAGRSDQELRVALSGLFASAITNR